jgi:hypothetical protein
VEYNRGDEGHRRRFIDAETWNLGAPELSGYDRI